MPAPEIVCADVPAITTLPDPEIVPLFVRLPVIVNTEEPNAKLTPEDTVSDDIVTVEGGTG